MPGKIIVVGSEPDSLINFRGPMLKALKNRGLDVIACAPSASSLVRDRLDYMDVKYKDIHFGRTGLSPFEDLGSFFALFRLFLKEKPDIFMGYTVKPVIYGSLAARLAGIAGIYSMITGLGYAFSGADRKSRLTGFLVRFLYRWSLRLNQNIFFHNQDDRECFAQLGLLPEGKGVLINGSGVDLAHYSPAAFPKEVSFLLIARLLKDKGIQEYVAAARLLKRRYPHVIFRIVGWIDDNPSAISSKDLQAWIDEGVIEYPGRLSDVRPAIAAATVYVLPSYREGMPRTVLEAMAMGRPVVTTDAPGCRETVEDGENGFVVPVRDVEALTSAMEKFIRQPDIILAMGARSRVIAEQRFDVEKINRIILRAMEIDHETHF